VHLELIAKLDQHETGPSLWTISCAGWMQAALAIGGDLRSRKVSVWRSERQVFWIARLVFGSIDEISCETALNRVWLHDISPGQCGDWLRELAMACDQDPEEG